MTITVDRKNGPILINDLKRGQKLFINCRGGLGRTVLIAAKLLLEHGLQPEDAIKKLDKLEKAL